MCCLQKKRIYASNNMQNNVHKTRTNQQSQFFDLESQLNQKHPLYLLANKIDWNVFEEAFKGLYCANNGRPAKPIRRMVGLLILKHVHNVSDESVVEQWHENIYYQYFCGEQSIQTSSSAPRPSSWSFGSASGR